MPRVKIEYRTASRANYEKFKAKFPQYRISFDQFCEILYAFSYEFRDYILETGQNAKWMFGLGEFTIKKKKRQRTKTAPDGTEYNNLPVDWKETKKLGKIIYHLNFHTDGYSFRWVWERKSARFYQSQIWSFKPSRITSRSLAAQLLKDSIYSQIYQPF